MSETHQNWGGITFEIFFNPPFHKYSLSTKWSFSFDIVSHFKINDCSFVRWAHVSSPQAEVKPCRWFFSHNIWICATASILIFIYWFSFRSVLCIFRTVHRFSPLRCQRAIESTSRLALNRSQCPPWSTSLSSTCFYHKTDPSLQSSSCLQGTCTLNFCRLTNRKSRSLGFV